ncbi:MAG: type IV pilus assembly protein PilM [Candidatus Pacebacteria bacterium]|nr:type IV pilus assembly protein PilM [Candidatus Paceibacterota bacterium]NUQ57139.1 type IV pilus assembly protein PilM [Candidatus Paceibacter sp.]
MDISLKDLSFKKLLGGLQAALKDKQSVLGVDIGGSSVKVVQLRKEKERAILETYGEVALGPYGGLKIGQNIKLPEDKIAEAVRDVVKESNAKATAAKVAIPLRSSFVKIITLPVADDSNISEIIAMEARRHIPIPVSEVALDWWAIPKTSDNKNQAKPTNSTEVLLVAIHNDVINDYKNIIKKAGLEAASYEIEAFSVVRSAISRGSPTIAVVDFGSASTKMAVVDYGIIKSSHLINKGSHDITLAMAQSLGVDFAKAEEMKKEIGLSDLPEHQEIVDVMKPILDYIFHEIGVFLKDFQARHNRSVSKIIFTGGGSLLKGLSGHGVKRLTVEVEAADPFGKTEHPVFLDKILKEIGPNFSVATGLALGEL